MNEKEQQLSEEAFLWLKKNEQILIDRMASPKEHEVDTLPISLFMAGSPGAGKTEVSKRLTERFNKKPVRVDADEIRTMCPGYRGDNAHIFQKAANKGVNILYDYALHHGLNIIMDGTFAYGDPQSNIQRSLDKQRKVEIFFIYQDPLTAWEFTKKREALEGRRVTREVFIDGFIKARLNANFVKTFFSGKLELHLITKDIEKGFEDIQLDINGIDAYLEKLYSKEELEAIIL